MKVNAFMYSLQARLMAENMPYSKLTMRQSMKDFKIMVRMLVAKEKYMHFMIDTCPPIQLIPLVIKKVRLVALEVQGDRT